MPNQLKDSFSGANDSNSSFTNFFVCNILFGNCASPFVKNFLIVENEGAAIGVETKF